MGTERKPVVPFARVAGKGPQLVPPRQPGSPQVSQQAVETADPHPLTAALILGGIAFIGAITFAGTIFSWILLRGTGVNWMFQGASGAISP